MRKKLNCILSGTMILFALMINAHAATVTFTGADQISEILDFGGSGYIATFLDGDHTLPTTLNQAQYLEAFNAFSNYIAPGISGFLFSNDVNTARGTNSYNYQGFVGMNISQTAYTYEVDAAFGGTLNGYIKFNPSVTGNNPPLISLSTINYLNFTQTPYNDASRNQLDTSLDPSTTRVVFSQVSPVPLPGAVWLLGSGLVGIAGLRRKLKR